MLLAIFAVAFVASAQAVCSDPQAQFRAAGLCDDNCPTGVLEVIIIFIIGIAIQFD